MTQAFVYPCSDLFCPRVVRLHRFGQPFVVRTPLATSTTSHLEQRCCSCSLSVCYCVFIPSVASSPVHFYHSDAALVCCQLCLHNSVNTDSQLSWPPSVNDGSTHTSGLRFCLNHPQFSTSRSSRMHPARVPEERQRSATWLVYPIGCFNSLAYPPLPRQYLTYN